MKSLCFSLLASLAVTYSLDQAPYDPTKTYQPLNLNDTATLLSNEYLPFEAGFGNSQDGLRHIAGTTYMRGVSWDMMAWWFGYVDSTEKYKMWHPRDHKYLEWHPPAGGAPGVDYIGGYQLVKEMIGGSEQHLKILFRSPEAYFGKNWSADFKKAGYVGAICARVGLHDFPTNSSQDAGHLVHLIHQEPDGIRMRSRFWLGDLGPEIPFSDGAAAVPGNLVSGLSKHCAEEMAILATVLPKLWRENSPAGKSGQPTGFELKNRTAATFGGPCSV